MANRPVLTLVAVGTVTRPLGNNCAVDLLPPSCWSLIVAATDTDAPAMLFVCLASLRHTLTLNRSVLSISSISAFASLTPSATTVTKPTATSLHPRALPALLRQHSWCHVRITSSHGWRPTSPPAFDALQLNIHRRRLSRSTYTRQLRPFLHERIFRHGFRHDRRRRTSKTTAKAATTPCMSATPSPTGAISSSGSSDGATSPPSGSPRTTR